MISTVEDSIMRATLHLSYPPGRETRVTPAGPPAGLRSRSRAHRRLPFAHRHHPPPPDAAHATATANANADANANAHADGCRPSLRRKRPPLLPSPSLDENQHDP